MNRFTLSQKKYLFLTGFIVFVAAILRFYNFMNRLSLGADQVYAILLSRYALYAQKLPLFGPFSSAGPFQTGGEWYWLVMLAQGVYPFSYITPWVVFIGSYVLFVFLMIKFGEELIGKEFGLIVGSIAAVSTSQIAQVVNITNQTPLALVSLLAVWVAIRFYRTQKKKYAFLLGLCVGLAPTIHLQGALLLPLLLITFIFAGKKSFLFMPYAIIGLLLPWVPIFWADSMNHFRNYNNMLHYYLYDQYNISLDVLGRRWLTYIFQFWPASFAHIIGGNIIISYGTIVLLLGTLCWAFYKRSISREFIILLLSFLGMVVMIRYTRTPLFDSYLMVTHPYIFLFTGWALFQIKKYKKIFWVIFIIILVGSLLKDMLEVAYKGGDPLTRSMHNAANYLTIHYPSQNFSVYDYRYKTVTKSQILVLFLDDNRKISDQGKQIGFISATSSVQVKQPIMYKDKMGNYVVELGAKDIKSTNWESINPKAEYMNVQEWYKFKK